MSTREGPPASREPRAVAPAISGVGVVVIGRNEATTLDGCIRSARASGVPVVYADSASSDDSVDVARRAGSTVIALDDASPLCAARGRMEGLDALLDTRPDTELVQFVDGDCTLAEEWLAVGARHLQEHPDIAAVCGRLRERDPDANAYHRLCDMEWDAPTGEVRACGGVAMYRVSALRDVGGFRMDLAAGEEPELCLRLRGAGWRIVRLPEEMASHDCGMSRFGQWWARAVRSGTAYAEGADLHGGGPERYNAREVRSIVLWGGLVPVALALALAAVPLVPVAGLAATTAVVLGLGLLGARIYRHRRLRGDPPRRARLYATFCVLAKPAQMLGLMAYRRNRRSARRRSAELEAEAAGPPEDRAATGDRR